MKGSDLRLNDVHFLPNDDPASWSVSQTRSRDDLAVEAAVHGDEGLLRQAMMLDPLTVAVCNPPEIWQMVDEMLVAQEQWLPQYKKAIAAAKKRLASGKPIKTRVGYRGAARLKVKSVAEMREAANQRISKSAISSQLKTSERM